MYSLKKIMIFILFIIIILVISIIGLVYFKRGEVIYGVDERGSEDPNNIVIERELKYVTDRNDYYAVKNMINKFYNFYELMYENDIYDDSDSNSITKEEIVYSFLDEDYIKFSGITKNNIKDSLGKISESNINITNMYVSQYDVNKEIYIVKGRMRNLESGQINDFINMVKVDEANKTFSVFLEDYINKYYEDKLKIGKEIEFETNDDIDNKNNYNKYDTVNVTDDVYVTDLMLKFKQEIMYDSEIAYMHIDEEYKRKKFEDFQSFKDYISSNLAKIISSKINKYSKKSYDDYNEYICIDQNGKYYIFREKSVMNYGIILDTYTMDLQEFNDKYDNVDVNTKVGMNIQKIIDAINEKDYEYVYNKLNNTFKQNNFSNKSDFIKFINNNFFENSAIQYGSFENLGNAYTYSLKIIDKLENKENVIMIIVKLLENRDFEISFEME